MSRSKPLADATTDPFAVNQVLMIGRVSAAPTVRALPSGDEMTSWRLIIGRAEPAVSRDGRRAASVDTIDCVAHKRAIQRLAARWVPGDVVEVRGSLRRRFWRGVQGVTSRCEVEVTEARRLRSPAAAKP